MDWRGFDREKIFIVTVKTTLLRRIEGYLIIIIFAELHFVISPYLCLDFQIKGFYCSLKAKEGTICSRINIYINIFNFYLDYN